MERTPVLKMCCMEAVCPFQEKQYNICMRNTFNVLTIPMNCSSSLIHWPELRFLAASRCFKLWLFAFSAKRSTTPDRPWYSFSGVDCESHSVFFCRGSVIPLYIVPQGQAKIYWTILHAIQSCSLEKNR
jgi:hypothetical protein